MPESMKLVKATLTELEEGAGESSPEGSEEREKQGGKKVEVQFNPETLKLSFSNQVDTGDQSKGPSAMQFIKQGTTKLTMQLWFDVTAVVEEGKKTDDVRKLTQEVIYFMNGQESKKDPKKLILPAVRFHWGTFSFVGIVDSIEESIEYFSHEGTPLRSSLSLSMSQQKILITKFKDQAQPGGGIAPGTKPLDQAQAGATVQSLAEKVGKGGSWQEIAAANHIENPRLIRPGQFIDLNPSPLPKR
jgi:hypothetical protein